LRNTAVGISALVAALVLGGCGSSKPSRATAADGPPAVPVSVAPAGREVLPVEVRAVGTAEAYRTVQVKSQVAGQLLSVKFTEGSQVRQGDLLFEIDPAPFEQARRQAEAAVGKDQALLRQAEANVARDRAQARSAEAEAARQTELLKENITPRAQYEQAVAAAQALQESIRADQAAIESARASLESDRAALERAKLDLGYCRIEAPVSGRAGNVLVHAGNLVKVNDAALVVINQIEPIFVSFGVPERYLSEIRARTAGGRKLAVDVAPQNGQGQGIRGELAVIDNAVDAATGTIRLKALFGNEGRVLWPGQFASVVLRLEAAEATFVPAEAVQAGQQGEFVYVVKGDQTVELRPVAVGATLSGKAIIEKGVAPGETVVTDGQLRLYPGARIRPVPASDIDSQKL
jgi:membrane fusion protein, multidrug efflux system